MGEMRIDAHRPVADGISFSDIDDLGLSVEQVNGLARRGVVFATEFRCDGRSYSGNVIATCWPAAEEIAFGRGLGEQIIGVVGEVRVS